MQLPTEMFRFQLPSPITTAYAARHSHMHCVFLVQKPYSLYTQQWKEHACSSYRYSCPY